ncbi:GGDEF domain-containing protein [Hahella sp. SMD15-11]|uniref:diguanylate cyclase n=1 Tax=Thermohahella caldifontis TaxID=3142973 RepID=A0AB39UW35_9GAMM
MQIRNENLLRARTLVTLYLGLAALFLLMALQNVRYGLYDLFYIGLMLVPVWAGGAVLSWWMRNRPQHQPGHVLILVTPVAGVFWLILAGHPAAVHWLYAVALISFIVLPLRTAFRVNTGILVLMAVALGWQSGFYDSLRFATSYALLAGLAGMYAYLYHHKTRYYVTQTHHDPLTGAFNLRHLDFTLKQEVSRSETTGHPLSLIALEVDYYDQLLDVHGQNITQEVIVALARQLQGMTRAGDSLYYDRNGRFYLLLPNTPEEGLLVIAERVRRMVEETDWPEVHSLTVSVGCFTRPAGMTEDRTLRDVVDLALQQAQASGHNRVQLGQFVGSDAA